ncbi:hypothetical protein DXG01_011218, partial [Tephrocybe rancida]
MRPRLKKKDLTKERRPAPSYTPIVHRRKALPRRADRLPALIFLEHGQALTQNSYLPPCVRPVADAAVSAHAEEENLFLDDGDSNIVDLPRGCFASAPLEPTLAVDFKVLDFVSTLFLHVAPNNTGWTDTVETFLMKQGYKLAYK